MYCLFISDRDFTFYVVQKRKRLEYQYRRSSTGTAGRSRSSEWRCMQKPSLILRLADVLRGMDSLLVIRVGNMGATSNSEGTCCMDGGTVLQFAMCCCFAWLQDTVCKKRASKCAIKQTYMYVHARHTPRYFGDCLPAHVRTCDRRPPPLAIANISGNKAPIQTKLRLTSVLLSTTVLMLCSDWPLC